MIWKLRSQLSICYGLSLVLCLVAAEVQGQSTPSNGLILPSKEQVSFRQQVTLATLPGLSAEMRFSLKEQADNINQVRVFALVDNSLFVFPLRSTDGGKLFRGSFPTPQSNLRYQFQILYRNGKSLMTDTYSIEPTCDAKRTIDYRTVENRFSKQKDLLAETQVLKRKATLLANAIVSLKDILAEEQK